MSSKAHRPCSPHSTPRVSAALRELILRLVLLLLLPLAIYVASFVGHMLLLTHYGTGCAFHKLPFNCRLLPPAAFSARNVSIDVDDVRCKWAGCSACEVNALKPTCSTLNCMTSGCT